MPAARRAAAAPPLPALTGLAAGALLRQTLAASSQVQHRDHRGAPPLLLSQGQVQHRDHGGAPPLPLNQGPVQGCHAQQQTRAPGARILCWPGWTARLPAHARSRPRSRPHRQRGGRGVVELDKDHDHGRGQAHIQRQELGLAGLGHLQPQVEALLVPHRDAVGRMLGLHPLHSQTVVRMLTEGLVRPAHAPCSFAAAEPGSWQCSEPAGQAVPSLSAARPVMRGSCSLQALHTWGPGVRACRCGCRAARRSTSAAGPCWRAACWPPAAGSRTTACSSSP